MRSANRFVLVPGCVVLLATVVASGIEGTGRTYAPNPIDDPTIYPVSLLGLDGSGNLVGEAANVTNAVFDRAYSATQQFEYDPAASWAERIHFAEAMTYHVMTSYYHYVRDLDVNGLEFQQVNGAVEAVVFDAEYTGTLWLGKPSSYWPLDRKISLGAADSALAYPEESDGMDGDIIVHEYSHAVQHFLRGGVPGAFVAPATNSTEHAMAAMEGFADYAATSYFDDPELGEWSAKTDRHREFRRTVNNFRSLPDGLVENDAHETGMIISGAMWDLGSAVGAGVADMLMFKTIETLPDNDLSTPGLLNTTFVDVRDTMLLVDSNLYGATHDEQIRQAFGVHGIGEYDFSTSLPMVLNPGNDYDDLGSMQSRTVVGATELAITFDEFVTRLDDSEFTVDVLPRARSQRKSTVDYLEILDGDGTVINTYTGRELQGQTITVPGDTVKFHLVTDSFLAPFGYRVVDISAVSDIEADYEILVRTFGSRIDLHADFNEDGRVGLEDFAILRAIWQAEAASAGHHSANYGAPIPEPTTLGMLVLGGLVVLRRQRLARELN